MSEVCHKPRSLKRRNSHEYRRKNSNAQDRWSSPKRRSPIDPLEQHRQLGAAQRHRPAGRLRPNKASAFEPLGQQTKPVAVEPEQLHDVPSAATEDEDMTGKRLLFEHRLHLSAESMEATAHVGHTSRDPDPCSRRKRNHERRLLSTVRTIARSTCPSRLIRILPGSSI